MLEDIWNFQKFTQLDNNFEEFLQVNLSSLPKFTIDLEEMLLISFFGKHQEDLGQWWRNCRFGAMLEEFWNFQKFTQLDENLGNFLQLIPHLFSYLPEFTIYFDEILLI